MKAAFTSLAALLHAPLAGLTAAEPAKPNIVKEHDIAAKQPGKMDELR